MSGRSPLIPLHFAPLVRSPRGKALPLQSGPVRTALLRRGRSCADGTKGLCPLDTHPQLIRRTKENQTPLRFWFFMFSSCAAMLNGLCPRRRWLPTKFHLDGVKAAALTIRRIPIHYIYERNDVLWLSTTVP